MPPSTTSTSPLDGSELAALRRSLQLTQSELARQLGVDAGTISRWERGALGIRHPELLLAAMERLGAVRPRRPGEHGVSDAGIPCTVREDGSLSFAGYGGACD